MDNGARIVDKRRNWEARVEMAVFKRPSNELSAYDKLVYTVLCGHANRDGNAMLYVRTIAEEASCSERQAQRAMSNLESRGLLVRRAQNRNGRRTFNIYEVYGFDAYIFDESPDESASETESGNGGSGVTDSHRCTTVTPPPSDSHPRGDCESGPNNVFKQPLFNSSKEHIPPTPQRGEEREKNFKSHKPQNQEYDTEGKEDKKPERARAPSEPWLYREILNAFNKTLRELPHAEALTSARIKNLGRRIREDPAREELEWWVRYFQGIRDCPWLMGKNPNGWKANFDWLTGESGMRKVVEGSFTKIPGSGFTEEEKRALQKKYTDERGRVDAVGLLREWRQLTGEGC